MARIKGVSKEEATDEVRAVFEEQEKRYGSILNTARIYALRPTIMKGVQALSKDPGFRADRARVTPLGLRQGGQY